MRDRRQLYVVLSMAAWISSAAALVLYATANPIQANCLESVLSLDCTSPPGALRMLLDNVVATGQPWFSFLALCTPGLVFGFTFLWWFSKTKPKTIDYSRSSEIARKQKSSGPHLK
jgi:hypothetical protein